jgi:peptidoglycan/xylan/chitin deacetylase (PgdA/CDA1 family)
MTRRRRAIAWCAPVCLVAVLAACTGEGRVEPPPGPTRGVTATPAAPAAGARDVDSAGAGLGGAAAQGAGATPSRPAVPTVPTVSVSVPRPSISVPVPTFRTGPIGPPPPTPGTGLQGWLFGKDWDRIPTDRKIVALTFDAGANADGVAPILATLAREHVAGTFFLTGQFATSYPSQVRDIAASGGRMGNHSLTHPYFTQLDDAAIRHEVFGAEHDIMTAGGTEPRPFFRFPFGDRNAHDIAVLNTLGYVPIRWTVDTLGWQGTSGGRSAASVTSRVLDALTPGEIVLMHLGSHPEDHSTLDADALPTLIAALRDRGYTFVTLDSLRG